MNLRFLYFLSILLFCACAKKNESAIPEINNDPQSTAFIRVLGIAQDGGYPHIHNTEEFEMVDLGMKKREKVISLGLIDTENFKNYLFEATPDLPIQLNALQIAAGSQQTDGVFLTHAHMGHYTGLMYFGREAMGAKEMPVYTMPRMQRFLKENGPWSQLVDLKNIRLEELQANTPIQLTTNLKVTPILVPHRDEFSETVGFKISGTKRTALFIPDIDKWEKWDLDIVQEVSKVDYAFLDATFFADGEIPRPMSEVPHPFIEETVAIFAKAKSTIKSKIIFIHFNHSNPVLDPTFEKRKKLEMQGYRFAKEGDRFVL